MLRARRHLPWGSSPLDDISPSGCICQLASPTHTVHRVSHSHNVLNRLDLVVFFHTTAVHRILAFRAFPSKAAASPFGDRYSLAVGLTRGPPGSDLPLGPFALAFASFLTTIQPIRRKPFSRPHHLGEESQRQRKTLSQHTLGEPLRERLDTHARC